MAEGVENCCALVCFLTPEYQASDNCKKELTYAMSLRKPVVPCFIGSTQDKTWKPSDWLGISICDLLYVNFQHVNKSNLSSKCDELIQKIHSIVGTSPVVSEAEDEDIE